MKKKSLKEEVSDSIIARVKNLSAVHQIRVGRNDC